VVQSNSATAQESAPAGEELSAQAKVLNGLANQFTLKRMWLIIIKNGVLLINRQNAVFYWVYFGHAFYLQFKDIQDIISI